MVRVCVGVLTPWHVSEWCRFDFLGLAKLSAEAIEAVVASPPPRNALPAMYDKAFGRLLPATEALLADFFAPFEAELEEMLQAGAGQK